MKKKTSHANSVTDALVEGRAAPDAKYKRYFLDVTDLVFWIDHHETLSGIQRVAVNVATELAVRLGHDRVVLCFFDSDSNEYKAISSKFLLEEGPFDVKAARVALGVLKKLEATPPGLSKYRRRPAKLLFHSTRLKMKAAKNDKKYFKNKGISLEEWQEYWEVRRATKSIATEKSDRIGTVDQMITSDDCLFLLSGSWNTPEATSAYEPIARKGVNISLLIYDLIPVFHSEHIVQELCRNFVKWLDGSRGYVSQYFTISEHCASEVRRYLEAYGNTQSVTAIPLAQQFPAQVLNSPDNAVEADFHLKQKISPDIANVIARPFVLVVGTLETRKNNLALAQAWDLLRREDGLELPRLVFAGRVGWLNDRFENFMAASGNLWGWVDIFHSPTDEELAYLYENCQFTALVSFVEGWGLPIGESLSYGKTAVVANNSSMPEVGHDMVEYCDAHSVQSIAKACRRLISDHGHRVALERRIKTRRLRTWDDVAEDFVRALTKDPENWK